jgi:hypothetical protein
MPPSKSETVTVKNADAQAFLGAAYLLTDEAFVAVSRRGKDWTATVGAKAGTKKFAARFKLDYENQLLRWRIARANRGLRADVLRRALALCEESGGKPAARQGTLLPEQLDEISRLLAEAAADKGPRDPLGVTKFWEDLK